MTDPAEDTEAEDRLVVLLRHEGVLGPPRRRVPAVIPWIAAAALFVAGIVTGSSFSSRGSLEVQLNRTDLRAEERLLLLERAGSAFERATEIYLEGHPEDLRTGAKTARVLWF